VQAEREVCDLGGRNIGAYGRCRPDCTPGPYCGDGVVDLPEEECDLGPDNDPYGARALSCKEPPRPL
jgi:hypothetical protein